MPLFETRHELDAETLERILGLIEVNTRVDGRSPVGEHKYAHLSVGAEDWTGVLAWEGDQLVGYAHTMWHAPGERPRVRVEVVVHPEVRADGRVARTLVDETKQVLAQAGGGVMWLWVHNVDDPRATWAHEHGFDVQRELAYMCRDLPARPEVPQLPDGVHITTFRPGVDDDAFLTVNNAAFVGHPENGDWDVDTFRARQRLDWFDPEGLFLAWRGDEPLGFHWTKWHTHEGEAHPAHGPVGEVYVLAVRPEAQGLGLGRLLLATGLAHLWDEGCRRAILYVDRASDAAVRLYTSAGFAVAHSEVCYQTVVEAGGADDLANETASVDLVG